MKLIEHWGELLLRYVLNLPIIPLGCSERLCPFLIERGERMIDLSKIRYRVVVMDGSGKQYHIQDFIQNLGWEENKNEISARISFTSRNDKTSIGYQIGRASCRERVL